ncbi:MAG: DUF1573 domain-containing protein, partial [Planctomycetota bacterium]
MCLCPLPDLPGQDKSFVRSAEPPAITTDLASIDFGEILAGEVVTKKLKISNIGKGDLDLLKLDFTCGCTIPQVLMPSGDIVVPDRKGEKMIGTLKTDESAVIDLEYSALGQRGKMKKSLTIYSNDPREREKMLVIEAMIKSPFEIQPRRLYFGDV